MYDELRHVFFLEVLRRNPRAFLSKVCVFFQNVLLPLNLLDSDLWRKGGGGGVMEEEEEEAESLLGQRRQTSSSLMNTRLDSSFCLSGWMV